MAVVIVVVVRVFMVASMKRHRFNQSVQAQTEKHGPGHAGRGFGMRSVHVPVFNALRTVFQHTLQQKAQDHNPPDMVTHGVRFRDEVVEDDAD